MGVRKFSPEGIETVGNVLSYQLGDALIVSRRVDIGEYTYYGELHTFFLETLSDGAIVINHVTTYQNRSMQDKLETRKERYVETATDSADKARECLANKFNAIRQDLIRLDGPRFT